MNRKELRIKSFSLSIEAADRLEIAAQVSGRTMTSLVEFLILANPGLEALLQGDQVQQYQELIKALEAEYTN